MGTTMSEDEIRVEAAAIKLGVCLQDIVMASLRASPAEVQFGHPCSHLIREGVTIGSLALARRLLRAANSGFTEFPLNGAGLKLYIILGRPSGITVRVGGDQEHRYPVTMPAIMRVIRDYGYERSD